MDKYTVDLDKVLNDFEYSEYSLESAKVNRTIQEEHPNSSFNSNHCSRNDIAVKHSINNVFLSLNEYLSSDITPKKIENVQNNLQTIGEPESTSFALKSQDIESQKFLPQSSKFFHQLAGPVLEDLSQDLEGKEGNTFTNNLVDTTDIHNDKCAINCLENAEIDVNDNSNATNLIDNKCLLDETPEEKNSVFPPQSIIDSESQTQIVSNFGEFNSKEILVDLKSSDSETEKTFDGDVSLAETMLINYANVERNEVENHICYSELVVNIQDIQLKEPNDDLDINEITEEKGNEVNKDIENIDVLIEENPDGTEENKEIDNEVIETKLNNVPDRQSSKDEINISIEQKQDEDNKIEETQYTEKEQIGFDNDVELDEENIEQYFEELEKELGIQGRDEENKASEEEIKTEIKGEFQSGNEDGPVVTVLLDNKEVLETVEDESIIQDCMKNEIVELDQEVQIDHSCEETVSPNVEKLKNSEETTEQNSLLNTSSHTNASTLLAENNTSELDETIKQNEAPTEVLTIMEKSEVQTDCSEEKENLENIPEIEVNPQDSSNTAEIEVNPPDSLNTTEIQPVAEESEKNSRPQNLTLVEEVQEPKRKISLIGEPGSTPYNNLYSTKDFGKSTSEGSGDHNEARATSPTYSDVSTDSVSSSSSEDTAEYNDAVSEVQVETRILPIEIVDASFQEIMQNNMVVTAETSKNDVTMNKDFKNNLKTGNVRSEVGTSGQSEESEGAQVDRQDVEGACALEISNSSSENLDNVVKTDEQSVGESGNGLLSVEWLGKQAPLWLPDSVAMSCLHCSMKFTVIKRRHHCRACGLVLCSKCCNLKYHLEYLNTEARVCQRCYEILDNEVYNHSESEISPESSSPSRNLNAGQDSLGQPNPNNPLEYCSTVPPTQQAEAGASGVPSVMVPVGVLKRKGSNKGRSNKSVMFCDGIRPGSDLTNLDTDFNYTDNQKAEKSRKSSDKSTKTSRNLNMIDAETKSFIPMDERSLPPTVTIFKTDIKYSPCENNSSVVDILKNEALTFALQSNVFVHVKIINMDCCVSRIAWCFSTEGLITVGQDEIVILLEFTENESLVPKEIFVHINYIYLEAVKGSSVKELGMSLHPSSPFLGSKNHSGFIFIRPTFQCLQNMIIPKEPYLIGILIHRWETPWAKLFPLRLVLRLGAEYKYYPSPIISTRERDSVFVEIGHTIINLLADFRNFSYSLPQIRGLTIHMEDKNTTVTIPKNRYDQVMKSLLNSSDHILAFAGNFSAVADSHLVCIQDTQSATNNYSTHAINICNQPRKVTGASFIVFNGALKSTSGLTAKSNIVEDGLMIQILPEHMLQVRDSLKNMKNHTIKCGCINEESDETVTIVWGEPDTTFNVGILSPIDNMSLTGVPSIRVHNGKDYTCNSGNRLIRWTEVFISQKGEDSKNQDPIDISKISENISKATCQALVKYLDLLVSNSFYKIGLRTHIHVENVSYLAGSNNVKLPPIYMKSLDNELIPVLHRIASNNITEQPIVLELIFRILNI